MFLIIANTRLLFDFVSVMVPVVSRYNANEISKSNIYNTCEWLSTKWLKMLQRNYSSNMLVTP